jgi:Arc/MetJ-type ribon-helix-helix transcriptional regulator
MKLDVRDFEGFACIGVDGQLFWLKLDEKESCEEIFKDQYQSASDKVRRQFEQALREALVSSAVEESPLATLISLYLEKLSSDDKAEWEALAALDQQMEAYIPALKALAEETRAADMLIRDVVRVAERKGLKVSLVLPDTATLLEAIETARDAFKTFLLNESLSAKALTRIRQVAPR